MKLKPRFKKKEKKIEKKKIRSQNFLSKMVM